MAAYRYFIGIVFTFIIGLCPHSFGQVGLAGPVIKPKPQPITVNKPTVNTDSLKELIRNKVMVIANAEVGVVERTGRNDHPRIVIYHKTVSDWLANYRPAQPYCASFVNYVMLSAGVKVTGVPNPARARDWFLVKKRIVLTQQSIRGNQRMIKLPQKGSVVGYIFYGNAISHVEILDKIDLDGGYIYCVGANTSSRGAATSVVREGQGVYYVKRKIKMFYQIADII